MISSKRGIPFIRKILMAKKKCSFCNTNERMDNPFIAGNGVYICSNVLPQPIRYYLGIVKSI